MTKTTRYMGGYDRRKKQLERAAKNLASARIKLLNASVEVSGIPEIRTVIDSAIRLIEIRQARMSEQQTLERRLHGELSIEQLEIETRRS